MYFSDYVPSEQEIAIEETRQRLVLDARAKFQRVQSINLSIAPLEELRVEAEAESAQANKRYIDYINDNGLSTNALEAAVSE